MNIGKIKGFCSSCNKDNVYCSNPIILTTISENNRDIPIFHKCEPCDLIHKKWLNYVLPSGYTRKQIGDEWSDDVFVDFYERLK